MEGVTITRLMICFFSILAIPHFERIHFTAKQNSSQTTVATLLEGGSLMRPCGFIIDFQMYATNTSFYYCILFGVRAFLFLEVTKLCFHYTDERFFFFRPLCSLSPIPWCSNWGCCKLCLYSRKGWRSMQLFTAICSWSVS